VLQKDGSVSVFFSSVCDAETTYSLAENFKMRFGGFRSHATNVFVYDKQFSVEVSDIPERNSIRID
jgi:hypothetical protein